jgi:histidyl-tRNA synthetase
VGPDDRARGEVIVKDLREKTQEPVRREAVRERVIAGIRG